MVEPRHLRVITKRSTLAYWLTIVFNVLVSALCALYLECFCEVATLDKWGEISGILSGVPSFISVLRLIAFFAVFFTLTHIILCRQRIFDWLIDHRYALALALLLVLIIGEISGSSLALWGPTLGDNGYQGVLFGIPRAIRSDEWLVFTPFSFSQTVTGSHAISSVIRGGGTDVTMVYAQPSWSLASLFRPTLWGYLVLGPTKGLALFWNVRAIALVVITFEFMLLITKGNRLIAAYGAILIGFAPIVEWWFSINGMAELFIYGQGLVLAFHHYLHCRTWAKRWLWSILMGWLAGCYLLILYPPWQIPLFYAYLGCAIWVLVDWIGDSKTNNCASVEWKLVIPPATCFVVFLSMVGITVFQARDVITALLHSAYPGRRSFTGGGYDLWYAFSLDTLLSPIFPDGFLPNVCETATVVSLCPLGFLLALIRVLRGTVRKQVDAGLVCLLIPYALLVVYEVVGFPSPIATITLLGSVQASRVPLATGYLDVLLLIRCISQQTAEPERSEAKHDLALTILRICALGGTVLAYVYVTLRCRPSLCSPKPLILLFGSAFLLATPYFLYGKDKKSGHSTQGPLLLSSALVVLVAGLCINPVQHGADSLLQSTTLKQIAQVVQANPQEKWVTDSSVMGQACIVAGAPTITSVNTYPNLELWSRLDPTGQYDWEYNRYAHVSLELGSLTTFENPTPDTLHVTISPSDVHKLGATYWLSSRDLSRWNTKSVHFTPVESLNGYTVFRIES